MKDFLIYILIAIAIILAIIIPMRGMERETYTIFTPYEYPVVPGMPEWEALRTDAERVDVCRIPEHLIKEMSTEALLGTYISHPLATNIFLHASYHKGFLLLINQSGMEWLEELLQRDDLNKVICEEYVRIPVCKNEDEISVKAVENMWEMDLLEVLAAETDEHRRSIELVNAILDKCSEKDENSALYRQYGKIYNRTFDRVWAEKNNTEELKNGRALYPIADGVNVSSP